LSRNKQILAEGAFAHSVSEIPVRGRNDADIDRHRPRAATRIDHALLDGAQQFGLQAHIHFGDFIQQQGAAGGFLEFPDTPGDAPVNAPFSWPNNSDSKRCSGIAAQLMLMKGFLARLERVWT